jgi:hypothetical protein
MVRDSPSTLAIASARLADSVLARILLCVPFDGSLRHHKALGDRGVGHALCDQLNDFKLPWCQRGSQALAPFRALLIPSAGVALVMSEYDADEPNRLAEVVDHQVSMTTECPDSAVRTQCSMLQGERRSQLPI